MDNSSLSGQGPSLQQRELALGGGIDGLDGKICVEKIARNGRDGSAGAAVLHDDRKVYTNMSPAYTGANNMTTATATLGLSYGA